MKQAYFNLFFLLLAFCMPFSSLKAQENHLIEVSGTVLNRDTKEPLSGVGVVIKGTMAGTTSDQKGNFKLRSKLKFPFYLLFSSVGFATQEFEVKDLSNKLNIE